MNNFEIIKRTQELKALNNYDQLRPILHTTDHVDMIDWDSMRIKRFKKIER